MKKALNFFNKVIKQNKLSHLYLINGLKGSGKLKLAYKVSSILLCENKDNVDKVYNKIINNNHPNVYYIEPEGTTIKKEQILNLQEEFSKTSLYGGPRVYIINYADKLNKSSANSLLKFLEEPDANNVYGFLLTENKDLIIKTIKSRAQIINLKRIDKEEIKSKLKENIEIDKRYIDILAEITQNSNDAVNIANMPETEEIVNLIEKISKYWCNDKANFKIVFEKGLEKTIQSRNAYKVFSELLFLFFMDIIHYKFNEPITYEFIRENIKQINKQMNIDDLLEILNIIKESIYRQNFNINLYLEYINLLIKLDKLRWKNASMRN